MRYVLAFLLAVSCGLAQAQVAQVSPFNPNGNTITFTAAGTCPTPVRAVTPNSNNNQYIITNIGSYVAFISYGSSAEATANCVIPDSTARAVIPVLPLSQITVTTFGNSFFTGITASNTSVIYISPGTGQ